MIKAFIKETPFAISLLLIAAAVGFLALVVPIAGNKALIVRSGSMQPTIGVGDLITVRPQPTYKVGDVIAFKDAIKSSVVVTHRIISNEVQGGKIYFKTKGDANKNTDFNVVPVENIIGKANTAIPGIGRIIAFTKTNTGFAAVVIFPALLVIVFEMINIFKEIKRQKRGSPLRFVSKAEEKMESPLMFPIIEVLNPPKLGRSGLGLRFQDLRVVLPILMSLVLVYSTFAFFSDTETSTGNVFQAAASFPSPTPEAGDVVINEINWVGSSESGNDEWIELFNATASPVDLTNWVVENLGTGSGPGANITIPSGTIPAGGFFLISQFNKAGSLINIDPDFITTSISLSNGGEQLVLKSNTATIIDTANGSGEWFAGDNSNPKKSMERNTPLGVGTVSGSWHTATSAVNMDLGEVELATPKAANSAP